MNFIHRTKRTIAVALALVMMLGLSACGGVHMDAMIEMLASQAGVSVTAGQRLDGSAWINSDIEGSIDESTELDLKADFHTAVNRDWMLVTVAEGNEVINNFVVTQEHMLKNCVSMLRPGGDYEPDPGVMSEEELEHMESLIWNMMELAGDQDKRNELGVEPLAPYLEAVNSIETLDDMTEYLKNSDGSNFTGEMFFGIDAETPLSSRDSYNVHISFPNAMLLPSSSGYLFYQYSYLETMISQYEALCYVLESFGYSNEQVRELLMCCFDFERKLAQDLSSPNDRQYASYWEKADNLFTLEELENEQGNFPLTELISNVGVAESESFCVYEPKFLRCMGRLYTENNLESLKAYFTVHTVLEALPYLDEECQALHDDIMSVRDGISVPVPDAAENESETEDEDTTIEELSDEMSDELSEEQLADLELAQEYVFPTLYEAVQLVYVGRYCSSTMKADIMALLEDSREYYAELLSQTEWLSPETREKAVDKVNKIEFNVLYPHELTDYSSLSYDSYDEGGNLLEAVSAINRFHSKPDAERVNQPVKRSDWDITQLPTMDVNAYYSPDSNSIYILAGIISDGFFYDEDAPLEVNYARLGMVLGHEMTHAFDTSGYQYDAEGLRNNWWTNDDEVAFRQKSDRLANHYSLMNIYPGAAGGYNGQNIQGEAIADMGGVKCMLALAEDIPDFDYELFFRSYAEVWRYQTSLTGEMSLATDVHPLGFLRTNVTLQQFDKFYETFDIGPGDGMYLAPEDRIMVW